MDNEEPNMDEDELESEPRTNVVDAVLDFISVDVLSALVVIGVVFWVLAAALNVWALLRSTGRFGSGPLPDWYQWTEVGQQLAYAVWLGALAISVMKWLRERLQR